MEVAKQQPLDAFTNVPSSDEISSDTMNGISATTAEAFYANKSEEMSLTSPPNPEIKANGASAGSPREQTEPDQQFQSKIESLSDANQSAKAQRNRRYDVNHLLEFEGAGPYWALPPTRHSRAAMRKSFGTVLHSTESVATPASDQPSIGNARRHDELISTHATQESSTKKLKMTEPTKSSDTQRASKSSTTATATSSSSDLRSKSSKTRPNQGSKPQQQPQQSSQQKVQRRRASSPASVQTSTDTDVSLGDSSESPERCDLFDDSDSDSHRRSRLSGAATKRKSGTTSSTVGDSKIGRNSGSTVNPILGLSSSMPADEALRLAEQFKIFAKNFQQAFIEHLRAGKGSEVNPALIQQFMQPGKGIIQNGPVASKKGQQILQRSPFMELSVSLGPVGLQTPDASSSRTPTGSTIPLSSSNASVTPRRVSYLCSLAILGVPYPLAVKQAGLETLHGPNLMAHYLRVQEAAVAASLLDVVRAARHELPHTSGPASSSALTSPRSSNGSTLDEVIQELELLARQASQQTVLMDAFDRKDASMSSDPSVIDPNSDDEVDLIEVLEASEKEQARRFEYQDALAAVFRTTLDDWYRCVVKALTVNSRAGSNGDNNEDITAPPASGETDARSQSTLDRLERDAARKILAFARSAGRTLVQQSFSSSESSSVSSPSADTPFSLSPLTNDSQESAYGPGWVDPGSIPDAQLLDIPLPGCYRDVVEGISPQFELRVNAHLDLSMLSRTGFVKLLRALRGRVGSTNPLDGFELISIRCRTIRSVQKVANDSYVVVCEEETRLRHHPSETPQEQDVAIGKAKAVLYPWLGTTKENESLSSALKKTERVPHELVFITLCTTTWVHTHLKQTEWFLPRRNKDSSTPSSSHPNISCVLSPTSQTPKCDRERLSLPSLQLTHMIRHSTHVEM